jgi:hypothetical protein
MRPSAAELQRASAGTYCHRRLHAVTVAGAHVVAVDDLLQRRGAANRAVVEVRRRVLDVAQRRRLERIVLERAAALDRATFIRSSVRKNPYFVGVARSGLFLCICYAEFGPVVHGAT